MEGPTSSANVDVNQRTSRKGYFSAVAKDSASPVSCCRPSPNFHTTKPAACSLAAQTGKHWADHGNYLPLGPCQVLEQGLTRHVVIVDRLHHQLRVLDAVDDAQQRPRQAQQLTEAVEAEVDEVVGEADDLGKDKASSRPCCARGCKMGCRTASLVPEAAERRGRGRWLREVPVTPAGLAPRR